MSSPSPIKEEVVSTELLQRFLDRERAARKDAEQLLEARSRLLYQSKVALEREVQRTQAVFETAAEGILIFEGDGRIESLNPAAKRIFGIESGDNAVLNICDLLPAASFCAGCSEISLADRLKQVVGTTSDEIIGRRQDGTDIPLEFIVSEFKHNGVANYSGIVRDLSRRKSLETQLAHAQKMESVGQLAAGIAHELNTPIQFVGDNTRFLKSAFESIHDILDKVELLLQQCDQNTEFARGAKDIRDACESHELDFLKSEIPLAIEQTLAGAENVARIVRAMKVFSHPGAQEYQECDLNASLECTLTISRSEWKYCAEVETEFDPSLPAIRCMPGELNQAFLNLIVNGAHAIAAKSPEIGRLKIKTSRKDQTVIVEITDSGTGIPEAIQSRIFDPFFTTKGVGKGTGQGLSLCYNVIVEMHAGSLTFQSKEGEGTTFRVELPIDPSAKKELKDPIDE